MRIWALVCGLGLVDNALDGDWLFAGLWLAALIYAARTA